MGFWKKVVKKLNPVTKVKSAINSIQKLTGHNQGGSGEKAQTAGGKVLVNKSAQAGGGKINFRSEVDAADADPNSIVKPDVAAPVVKAVRTRTDFPSRARQATSQPDGSVGLERRVPRTQTTTGRGEAAKRLLAGNRRIY